MPGFPVLHYHLEFAQIHVYLVSDAVHPSHPLLLLLSQCGTSPLFHVQFCYFLTCIQVSQEAGKMVGYSHLLKNFPQIAMIHKIKGFSIVNESEVDIFLELPCLLNDLMNVGNLISGSSASLKPSLYIWKYSIIDLLKPSSKDFEHYHASM